VFDGSTFIHSQKTSVMKYGIILLVALAVAIYCLVTSTSIDHILLEKLLVACTIVFSTVALKVASESKVPTK
jgi:hypothetical protein